ncbi:MAG: T9SS type A sorting domain-containing protein [Bacteroidota bacterium]
MRNLFTLLCAFLVSGGLFAQSARLIHNPNAARNSATFKIDRASQLEVANQQVPQLPGTPSVPIGTTISDAVTSVKIGESSNAFTALATETNQLSISTDVGTNGGSVAFIFRQNIAACGGATAENGIYRYTLSQDGGATWDVGGGTSSPGNPPTGVCYGLGPLNPTYLQNSRYPNISLFLEPDSMPMASNLALVYAGPVLSPSGAGWDGNVLGTATNAAASPSITQESYPFSGADHYFAYSMVERVPGEFFYLSYTWDGATILGDVHVNKGVWNAASETIDWTLVSTFAPDYYLGFDGAPRFASISLGFSPDGSIGWLGGLGDLVGGQDTAYTVWYSESKDGGNTWGPEFAYDMTSYLDLIDSLSFFTDIDTVTGDTVPFGGGKPTTAFDFDMVVDKFGTPHGIAVIGNATGHNGDGTYGVPGYSILSGAEMHVLDFTKDSFGDFNMLYLGYQEFLRGEYTTDNPFTVDPHGQATVSPDGSIVMFSWADTDPANSTNGNDAPDLFTVAYDVDAQMLTQLEDRTADVGFWACSVFSPHSAPVGLFDGTCIYTMPITVMDLEDNLSLTPVSHWYFSDVTFDRCNDFTEDPVFFYNCKENPFTNTVNVTAPDCGSGNGAAAVVAGGGVAPFTYQWDAAAGGVTTADASTLVAGIYEVTVLDSKGCSETLAVTVNNANAPTLSVSTQADISCFGAGDGSATIAAAGGGGGETYMWSNGEMGATATALPAGTSTCTVTDMNGCVSLIQVTVAEPAGIALAAEGFDAGCNGEASGTAMASAVGGSGALTYSWSNGDMTEMADSLTAGTYTVTVTDANGCTTDETVNIGEPTAVASTISTTQNTSAQAPFNGSIILVNSGGTAPYEVNILGIDGITYDTTVMDLEFIQGFCGGDYQVTLTDVNGCTFVDTATVAVIGLGAECEKSVNVDPFLNAGVATVNIFPNPSNGQFSLNVDLTSRNDVKVEVFNFRGQLVAGFEAGGVINFEHNFDLSQEARGIYMVKITTEQGSVSEKVMIQ